MAWAGRLLVAVAALQLATAFVHGPVGQQRPSIPSAAHTVESLEWQSTPGSESSDAASSWMTRILGFGMALGLMVGLFSPAAPANAITAEQFSQLTYAQVKGSGLANRCPTVDSVGSSVKVPSNARMINMCFEPKSFAIETDTDKGKEFVTTRLLTRLTYSIEAIEGDLTAGGGSIKFAEEDGMDFSPVTCELPNGERVPFLFTVKNLVATGSGNEFKPGFTWGGEFSVPSYRTGGFLDPKGRGMYTGYDQAVALPAMQADGKEGQDELFRETNKVFETGRGAIEMEVNKVNEPLGEIGGVFVSKQPGDTDMGAKEPKTILLKGIFYGKVVGK